jgi:hypothetical protein
VQRLTTDRDMSGIRIAMVRACLARDHRLGLLTFHLWHSIPTVQARLYQLGRLFAVLENAHRRANPAANAHSGRALPAGIDPTWAAFPGLLATSQYHLSAIRPADKACHDGRPRWRLLMVLQTNPSYAVSIFPKLCSLSSLWELI